MGTTAVATPLPVPVLRACKLPGCKQKFYPRTTWQAFCCAGHKKEAWRRDNPPKPKK